MAKLYQLSCPKCNNKTDFYRYGKDAHGHQKYQCKKCWHQWAPETPERVYTRTMNYPACPVCGKATFLHHDREHYAHYTCSDKNAAIPCSYQSLRPFLPHPCPSSLERRISSGCAIRPCNPHGLIHVLSGQELVSQHRSDLRTVMNVRVSHTTISNWCTNFAPMFQKHGYTAHSGAQFQL